MRQLLSRLVHPSMCSHKIRLVQSYRSPDRMVDGEIVAGETFSQWQTCGLKSGHDGDHGGWGRGYRWRLRLANWLSD